MPTPPRLLCDLAPSWAQGACDSLLERHAPKAALLGVCLSYFNIRSQGADGEVRDAPQMILKVVGWLKDRKFAQLLVTKAISPECDADAASGALLGLVEQAVGDLHAADATLRVPPPTPVRRVHLLSKDDGTLPKLHWTLLE